MLTAFLLAAMLTETCALDYRPNPWGPDVEATCSDPGAQRAADAALSGLRLPRLHDYEPDRPDTMSVDHDGAAWRVRPLILAMEPLRFPTRPMEKGAFPAQCAYGARVGDDGRLAPIEIVCDIDDEADEFERYHRDYERQVRRALRSVRAAAEPGACLHAPIDWIINGGGLDQTNIDLPNPEDLCP